MLMIGTLSVGQVCENRACVVSVSEEFKPLVSGEDKQANKEWSFAGICLYGIWPVQNLASLARRLLASSILFPTRIFEMGVIMVSGVALGAFFLRDKTRLHLIG